MGKKRAGSRGPPAAAADKSNAATASLSVSASASVAQPASQASQAAPGSKGTGTGRTGTSGSVAVGASSTDGDEERVHARSSSSVVAACDDDDDDDRDECASLGVLDKWQQAVLMEPSPDLCLSSPTSLSSLLSLAVDVLYVVAEPLERYAVRNLLRPVPGQKDIYRSEAFGMPCHVGDLAGSITVLVRVDVPGAAASECVIQLAQLWTPRIIVSSGIAAALHAGLAVGDVVIADSVLRVDTGRWHAPDRRLVARIPAPTLVLDAARRALPSLRDWAASVSLGGAEASDDTAHRQLSIRIAPVAAQDAHVRQASAEAAADADATETPVEARKQRLHGAGRRIVGCFRAQCVPEAAVLDTSPAGLHYAQVTRGGIPWLLVKAVADKGRFCDHKHGMLLASVIAANVVYRVLQHLPMSSPSDLPLRLSRRHVLPPPVLLMCRADEAACTAAAVADGKAGIVVLSGRPGVGKTAVATDLAYAQSCLPDAPRVLWLDCLSLPASLPALAKAVLDDAAVTADMTLADMVSALSAQLRAATEPWLLFLDHADDGCNRVRGDYAALVLGSLLGAADASQRHVVVLTAVSRSTVASAAPAGSPAAAAAAAAVDVPLPPLQRHAAAELLMRQGAGCSARFAHDRYLGRLLSYVNADALPLVLLGRSLRQLHHRTRHGHGIDVSVYDVSHERAHLVTCAPELLQRPRDAVLVAAAIVATADYAWGDALRHVLRAAAWLLPHRVPVSLVQCVLTSLGYRSACCLRKFLRRARRHGFVCFDTPSTLAFPPALLRAMRPLPATALATGLSPDNLLCVLQHLLSSPASPDDLLPHLVCLADPLLLQRVRSPALLLAVLKHAELCYQGKGASHRAAAIAAAAVTLATQRVGTASSSTVNALARLAGTLLVLKRSQDARDVLAPALPLSVAQGGLYCHDTGIVLLFLGLAWDDNPVYSLQYLTAADAVLSVSLPPDHPDRASARSHLIAKQQQVPASWLPPGTAKAK